MRERVNEECLDSDASHIGPADTVEKSRIGPADGSRTIWHRDNFTPGQFDTGHVGGQFDTTDNLTPQTIWRRTIWHRTIWHQDNSTPGIKGPSCLFFSWCLPLEQFFGYGVKLSVFEGEGVKLSWCQIFHGVKLSAVSNCPIIQRTQWRKVISDQWRLKSKSYQDRWTLMDPPWLLFYRHHTHTGPKFFPKTNFYTKTDYFGFDKFTHHTLTGRKWYGNTGNIWE